MKRTISTLVLAAPLATVALALGAGPAMAQPAEPQLDKVKAAEVVPDQPEEELPQPEQEPERPDGPPPIIKIPDPCPTHGPCDDRPDDEKDPGDGDGGDGSGDFEKPNRIDAGADASDGGLQLAWLMAGSGLITATGAAYAVRRRTSMGA